MPSWQAERGKLKPPREQLPAVPADQPCIECGHARSSHRRAIMFGTCRVAGCDCPAADYACGCGHPLGAHMFGTVREGYPCAMSSCACHGFGPKRR